MMQIRYTKFPYIFWSSTKPFETEISFEEKILNIKNTENGKYIENCTFKRMNIVWFLVLKYLPLIVFLAIAITKYDFMLEKTKLLSYCFALALLIPVLLENIARKISLIFIFLALLGVSFSIDDFSLVAFSLKYFILLFCVITIFIELKYLPFSVIKEDKVIAHFLIKKNELNLFKNNGKEDI